MKILIIPILFFTLKAQAFECKLNYENKSPAQIEKESLEAIQKYTAKADRMRTRMEQPMLASQVQARNKVRILNSYLKFSADRGALYSQFKNLFIETEISYYRITNYQARIQKINEFQKELIGKDAHLADFTKMNELLASWGYKSLPEDFQQARLSLDKIVNEYSDDIIKARKNLVINYDDYMAIRFGMNEMLAAEEISQDTKKLVEGITKKMGLGADELASYKFLFAEQNLGKWEGLTEQELKDLMNLDPKLKRQLWKNRYGKQLSNYIGHLVLKARIHTRILALANSKIPAITANWGIKTLKKTLAKFTNDLVDFEMRSRYSGFIGLQVSPATTAKSMDAQIDLLREANAHSVNPDEYLIAYARSVDGKKSFDNIRDYLGKNKTTADYESLFTKMEAAESEAKLLGDLTIEGNPLWYNVPFYALEIASAWAIYEYFDFNGETEKIGFTESKEGSEIVHILESQDSVGAKRLNSKIVKDLDSSDTDE